MYNHTHLNFNNQFITLIDMKAHAQNQLQMSFCFWDLKVLIVSLADVHLKLHHQCVPLIDVYIQTKKILKFKNPAVWFVKSIFTFANQTWESSWECNLGMRFLPDIWF